MLCRLRALNRGRSPARGCGDAPIALCCAQQIPGPGTRGAAKLARCPASNLAAPDGVRIVETAIKRRKPLRRTRVQFCSAHAEASPSRQRYGCTYRPQGAPERRVRSQGLRSQAEHQGFMRRALPALAVSRASRLSSWATSRCALQGARRICASRRLRPRTEPCATQNTLLKAKLSSGAGDQALQAKVWRLERELEAALGGAEAVKKRAHVPHMR